MSNNSNSKYYQIYEELKKSIIAKKYVENDFFPTEVDLQKKYGVSRITIRSALQLLESDGYIKKVPGLGTIVNSNKRTLQLNRLISFNDEHSEHITSSKLVDFRREPAPEKVRLQLKLSPMEEVYVNERIRIIDDENIGFQRVYVPKSYIELNEEDFNSPEASLYKIFENKSILIESATEIIESIVADDVLADHLKIKTGEPLLYITRNTIDDKNRNIEYAEIYYRADRYRYEIQLNR
ncbi:GntR family transcriptional regulator [Enterococcus casseliflavus]|uniref:GntR family transcriptional regulator n=1 Tax=Enterococcus casseliflavus TaxID=37734 RepID=UPI001C8B6C06|nr:GntR family transcriptional regulator [Enterococcus casseliflavus]MBX9115527.1 GntR family transcriptional regulator [Enterococcus casseliflavus]MBX9126142.1 GntR family transcriptional regulator [Enterococcus casseliflavus]